MESRYWRMHREGGFEAVETRYCWKHRALVGQTVGDEMESRYWRMHREGGFEAVETRYCWKHRALVGQLERDMLGSRSLQMHQEEGSEPRSVGDELEPRYWMMHRGEGFEAVETRYCWKHRALVAQTVGGEMESRYWRMHREGGSIVEPVGG